MSEIDNHIRVLYAFDMGHEKYLAGKALKQIGLPAIDPLFEVASGAYPTPDLSRLKPPGLYWQVHWRLNQLFFDPEGQIQIMQARLSAIQLIGKIGGSSVVERLMALYETETDERILASVRSTLTELKDIRAIEILISALKIRDGRVPLGIVYLMGEWRDPRAVEPLIDMLNNLHVLNEQFFSCLTALGKIGGEKAVDALLKCIERIFELPPERWAIRRENMGEDDWGGVYHAAHVSLHSAFFALELTGDTQAVEVADTMLAKAPSHIPRRETFMRSRNYKNSQEI